MREDERDRLIGELDKKLQVLAELKPRSAFDLSPMDQTRDLLTKYLEHTGGKVTRKQLREISQEIDDRIVDCFGKPTLNLVMKELERRTGSTLIPSRDKVVMVVLERGQILNDEELEAMMGYLSDATEISDGDLAKAQGLIDRYEGEHG